MKKTNTIIIILTVLVVLFVVNFLAARHSLRVDLTKNKLYTLSDSTRKILGGLDDVVTIRAYFTADPPPALEPVRRDVDDMLSEFKSAAGSRLQVEFIDPASNSLEEQKAAMLGIPPLQVNVVERDKQQVAKVYLGMAVLFGDRQQVIPVVTDLGNLEYQLAEAILKVSTKEAPKIAWWEGPSDGNANSQGKGFNAIKNSIEKRYEILGVTDKNFSELDPKKYPALVVVSPRALSGEELFAIDQYLMGGGHLIMLIDRFDVGTSLTVTPVETNATDIMIHYGATVEDSLVVDQSAAMAAFSGGVVTYHIPYAYWPEIRRNQLNAKEPIVSGLETIVLPWTSPLVLDAAGVSAGNILEIANSSNLSTTVVGKDAKLDPQSANESLASGKKEPHTLIAILNGPFKSYFSDGKAGAPKGANVVKDSLEGSRIFVAGSSRWISDSALQMFPQNAKLFDNALDSFAMGMKLIGIRSRDVASRPIALMSDGARMAIKYANMIVGPVIVVLAGFVFFMFRRAKQKAVKGVYGNL